MKNPKIELLGSIYDEFEYWKPLPQNGGITFKQWGHGENAEKYIAELLEDLFDGKVDFKIIKVTEQAYSCDRFYDGNDAKEEGYGYWINYSLNWKKGLGKCTTYGVHVENKKVVPR